MKIIASWSYKDYSRLYRDYSDPDDLDKLEKAFAKEYAKLIPVGYENDRLSSKEPLDLVKDGLARKSGYITYIVEKIGNRQDRHDIATKLSREKVIKLLNDGFINYIVKSLIIKTTKYGEYYSFQLEYRRKR